MGFGLALIAALAWGTYAVFFKLSKSENLSQFQVFMGVGIFVSTLIICFLLGYPMSLNIYGLIAGVMWGGANALTLTALSNLGISKTMPVISSLVIISTFLWGAIAFGEATGLLVGFLGISIIIVGVILVSSSSSGNQTQSSKKGFAAAIMAGLIFGIQLVPLKLGHVETKDFFFSLSLGILAIGGVIAIVKKVRFDKKGIWLSILSGVIWNIGNLVSLLSIALIGLSKAMPISQLATLVAVCWGLFFFKEIKERRFKIQILIGAVILMIGIITLGSA